MSKVNTGIQNQLEQMALDVRYAGEGIYRQEAKEMTESFLKSFGIFVGLYNMTNGSALTINQAIQSDELLQKFSNVRTSLKSTEATLVKQAKKPKKAKSTKRMSYEAFKTETGNDVSHTIYRHLQATNPMSRSDLAKTLKIRLSTVCSQVNHMLGARLLAVVGTKWDVETKRNVEIVAAQ